MPSSSSSPSPSSSITELILDVVLKIAERRKDLVDAFSEGRLTFISLVFMGSIGMYGFSFLKREMEYHLQLLRGQDARILELSNALGESVGGLKIALEDVAEKQRAHEERTVEKQRAHEEGMAEKQRAHDERMAAHEERMAAHEERMADHQQRMGDIMLSIVNKLNDHGPKAAKT